MHSFPSDKRFFPSCFPPDSCTFCDLCIPCNFRSFCSSSNLPFFQAISLFQVIPVFQTTLLFLHNQQMLRFPVFQPLNRQPKLTVLQNLPDDFPVHPLSRRDDRNSRRIQIDKFPGYPACRFFQTHPLQWCIGSFCR